MSPTFKPRHAVVTGANRGLGFECVRRLAAGGVRVFACARHTDEPTWAALNDLPGEVIPVRLDVTDESQVDAMAGLVGDHTGGELDLLINNAGVYLDPGKSADQLDPADLEATLVTNVIGPHRVLLALRPLLMQATEARVVQVSSRLGSMALKFDAQQILTEHFGSGYSTSKAALNMLSLAWAGALRDSGVRLSIASPGWCRTSMGGSEAELPAADGANLILKAIHAPHGSFTSAGELIPW